MEDAGFPDQIPGVVGEEVALSVTIAAAIAPSSPPMIAFTLSARRLRA